MCKFPWHPNTAANEDCEELQGEEKEFSKMSLT